MEHVNTKFEEMSDDERAEFFRAYLNSSQEDIDAFDRERLIDVMQDRGIDQKTAEKVIRDQNEVAKRLLWEKIKREKLEEKLKKEVRGTRQWSEEEGQWKESESKNKQREDTGKTEESEIQDSRPDFLKTRNDLAQGIRKGEAIGKGILGVGTRRPLKEAIISGGAKLLQSLKGKPKSSEDIERQHELLKAKQEYEHEEALERIRNPSEHREREPSFKDLGRGSLGSERYEVSKPPSTHYKSTTPDFFGNSNQFMLGSNPMGSQKIRTPKRPPSTSIPSVKGRKPPRTKIVISKIKPPSTKLKTLKLKTIKIKNKIKATQKYVPEREERNIKKRRKSNDFLGLSNYI